MGKVRGHKRQSDLDFVVCLFWVTVYFVMCIYICFCCARFSVQY